MCYIILYFHKSFSLYVFHLSVIDDSGNVIFCWNEYDKGLLLSAFFYGYMVFQVLGGTLAEKFGTKIVLGGANLFCSLLTLVIPVAAKQNIWFVFGLKVMQGVASGVTYPSLPPLIMRQVNKLLQ